MKKLMIAAAIVCAAAVSQAAVAQWNWKTSGTGANQVIWDNGSVNNLYSTTPAAVFYLFDAGTLDQDKLLAGLRDKTYSDLSAASSVKSTTLNTDSKMVASDTFSYGTSGTGYKFYMAVMDEAGNVFLSDSVSVTGQDATPAAVAFSSPKAPSQKSWTSDAGFTFGGDGGKGAGWYAVPEPTSGLLLLLGVAGLALRRRRA